MMFTSALRALVGHCIECKCAIYADQKYGRAYNLLPIYGSGGDYRGVQEIGEPRYFCEVHSRSK